MGVGVAVTGCAISAAGERLGGVLGRGGGQRQSNASEDTAPARRDTQAR